MINNHSEAMSQSDTRATVLALYPEDSREAAALLKQAVPLMVRHNIPPNPVHYALWYTSVSYTHLTLPTSDLV